jgi:DsbC/DsbD-like thiol-disulfide interchange protein
MKIQAIQIVRLTLIFMAIGNPGLQALPTAIPHGTVELIAEHNSIQPGNNFQIGLKFQLEKGWHIYWINPGDAGQPPRVTWNLPSGLSAGDILWPYPKALSAFSLVDFGYEDEVLLLVPMQASTSLTPTAQTSLSADIKLIVCQDVCIPGKTSLSLSLPVTAQTPAANFSAQVCFEAARQKIPKPAPASWKISVADRKDYFYLNAVVGRSIKEAFFFPLEESQIENVTSQKVQLSKSGFAIALKKSAQLTKPIQRLRGVLLLGDKAYKVNAPVFRSN